MEFSPEKDGEGAGLIITQNERFSFYLLKERRDGREYVSGFRVVNGRRELLCSVPAKPGRVYLHIEGSLGKYSFYYGYSEREMIPLAVSQDGFILSTLVADGYIGTYLGMYASAGGKVSQNYVDFDWFRYEIVEE